MDSVVKLLEAALAVRRMAGRARIVARRGALALGILVFAGLFVLAAIGCLTAALWIYALPLLGPSGTPAAVAGGFLVLAIALFFTARRLLHPRAPAAPPTPSAAAVDTEIAKLIAEHKTSVLLAALLAGLAAGMKGRD